VVSKTPFAVEECTIGTGAACGSIYLDQGFENLLKGRFGKAWEKVLTPKRLIEAVRYFDSSIKCEFNPLDPSAADAEFEVPMHGVDDIPWIGCEDGYLRLTKFYPCNENAKVIVMTFKVSSVQSLTRFWD
jgi:hypothetical protein